MELVLSLVAVVVAVVALGLGLGLRSQVAQIPRVDAQARADIERLRQELTEVRRELTHSQRELDELKAVTQIPPAPPLPRARSVGLTDLREQLRAAHREPEPSEE